MPESESNSDSREKAVISDDLLAVAECNVCGSRDLTWHCQAQNRGGVQDGRIKMNEVGVIFFLGCDECSETVRLIDGDVVAVALTASLSANVEVTRGEVEARTQQGG